MVAVPLALGVNVTPVGSVPVIDTVGVGVPVVHLALGWLSRKYAKRIGGREDS